MNHESIKRLRGLVGSEFDDELTLDGVTAVALLDLAEEALTVREKANQPAATETGPKNPMLFEEETACPHCGAPNQAWPNPPYATNAETAPQGAPPVTMGDVARAFVQVVTQPQGAGITTNWHEIAGDAARELEAMLAHQGAIVQHYHGGTAGTVNDEPQGAPFCRQRTNEVVK